MNVFMFPQTARSEMFTYTYKTTLVQKYTNWANKRKMAGLEKQARMYGYYKVSCFKTHLGPIMSNFKILGVFMTNEQGPSYRLRVQT